jgi:hypothetical protein
VWLEIGLVVFLDEIVKISALVHGMYSSRYINPAKLICVVIERYTSFIYLKGWCPFKLKK